MAELHIRVVLGQLIHYLSPQDSYFQHVGLVHGAELLVALLSQLKGNPANALELMLGVTIGVETLALAIFERVNTARLTKVNATGELSHDHDIQACDDLSFERGS